MSYGVLLGPRILYDWLEFVRETLCHDYKIQHQPHHFDSQDNPYEKIDESSKSRLLVQATPHVFGQSFLLPCLNHLIDGMRSVKAFARSSPSGAAPEDTSSKLDKSNWSISGLLAKNNTVGGTRAAWVTCGNRNTHICPILQNTVLIHLTPLKRPLWGNPWVI